MNPSKSIKNDAKTVFREKGTCSRTFAYLLNREFGNNKASEERATDPMAGGLMQKGHQCGMLWGASLAVGAEAYRRSQNNNEAIHLAITATQKLLESFSKRTNTINCRDIIHSDLDNFIGLTKYMIKTTLQGMNNSTCFNLAENWLPEAIESAKEGLLRKPTASTQETISCATEVAKKMGATNEEMTMVAGFAGGLGLSGNACGALSTAIWMNSLAWVKGHPEKSAFKNKNAKATLEVFNKETNSEMLCHNICQQEFKTIEAHTQFIKNGGCSKLIETLAES
jgi:hypothetical protein